MTSIPRTLFGRRPHRFLAAAIFWFLADACAGEVEVLRDRWGVPHVFADTDAGAFYGLGYATAEDRAFQMTHGLRLIQGRLSEVIGEVSQVSRRETSVDHDRKMRTSGFHRAARRTAGNLDRGTFGLLEACCGGQARRFTEVTHHADTGGTEPGGGTSCRP